MKRIGFSYIIVGIAELRVNGLVVVRMFNK